MSTSTLIALGLVAMAGFLLGGVYTTWRTTKLTAGLLGIAAMLAPAGAAAWLQ